MSRNIDPLDKRYFSLNIRKKIDEYKNNHGNKLSELDEICKNIFWTKHLKSILGPNTKSKIEINPILIRLIWLFYSESYDYFEKRAFLITVNFIDYIVDLFLDYLDEWEEHKNIEENSDDILIKQYKINIEEICKNKKFFKNKKQYNLSLEYLFKYTNVGLQLIQDSSINYIDTFKNRINKRKQNFQIENEEKRSKTIIEDKKKKTNVETNYQSNSTDSSNSSNFLNPVIPMENSTAESGYIASSTSEINLDANTLIDFFNSIKNKNPNLDIDLNSEKIKSNYFNFLSNSSDPYTKHQNHKQFLNFVYNSYINGKLELSESYLDILRNESEPYLYHRNHLEYLNNIFDEFKKKNNVYPNLNSLHMNYFENLSNY